MPFQTHYFSENLVVPGFISLRYINTATRSSRLGIGCKAGNLSMYGIAVANSKEVKIRWPDSRQNGHIWQYLLRKAMAKKKRLFC
jgi:hypothetical protein